MRLLLPMNGGRVSPFVPDVLLAAGLVGLELVMRLLPHAWQFTPMVATGLFAGAVLRVRPLALAVPVVALGISDALLGFYDWRVMAVVYAAGVLPARLVS